MIRASLSRICSPALLKWPGLSTLDAFNVIHASDLKVRFSIQFCQYKEDGSEDAAHHSLWIIMKKMVAGASGLDPAAPRNLVLNGCRLQ
ncbi:MAG: hypothetical protein JW943_09690 [Deltaproteobacteria bacterium]|nr:hypothetical protein [Deltaproteobacteria bacterium]